MQIKKINKINRKECYLIYFQYVKALMRIFPQDKTKQFFNKILNQNQTYFILVTIAPGT